MNLTRQPDDCDQLSIGVKGKKITNDVCVRGLEDPKLEDAVEELRQNVIDLAPLQRLLEYQSDYVGAKVYEIPFFSDFQGLARLLVSVGLNQKLAFRGFLATLDYRLQSWRKPILYGVNPEMDKMLDGEILSGAIRILGVDRYGRSVISMESGCPSPCRGQMEQQMDYLKFSMEFAMRLAVVEKTRTDKICLVIDMQKKQLEPIQTVRETIKIFTTLYPESLGTCVIFQGPKLFTFTYKTLICHLISARVDSKVHFVSGDFSPNSPTDTKLRYLIGDDWREFMFNNHDKNQKSIQL